MVCGAGSLAGGPWSQLPVAVAALQSRPDDPQARGVLAAAEASLLAEASRGDLGVVVQLVEAYEALVLPLPGGEEKVAGMHRRVARALVTIGDAAVDPARAGRAWALAARYAPEPAAVDRLSALLVPPSSPEAGSSWTSPVDGAELVWHPEMRFHMGCTEGDRLCLRNERTSPWVEIPGVWIQRREVTAEQYRRCVQAGACTEPTAVDGPPGGEDVGELPVTGVTWRQARDYALWAGRRLPSESEWERAARGREPGGRFPWGDQPLPGRANVVATFGEDRYPGLAPVGRFPATGWGVLDIAGNVWEWCEDVYNESLISAPRDGRPRTEGGHGRVLRGGSWQRPLDFARVSSRAWEEDDYAHGDVGFRTAMDGVAQLPRARLVTLAERAFGRHPEVPSDLAGSSLDTADQRYLSRRAVTWLVLEGRIPDALSPALRLLRHEPADAIGRDVLERVEVELLFDAREGQLPKLEHLLVRYRAAGSESDEIARRFRELSARLVHELEGTARASWRRGDVATARLALQIADQLAPGDRRVQELRRSLEPTAGTRLKWRADGKEMVWCPAGAFTMGAAAGDRDAQPDEGPAHEVRVEAFWIDSTEVTNDEYRRCVADGACDPPHRSVEFDDPTLADHPVLWVDWFQARQYARWAGKRLPSEAEWEYAARAGVRTSYPWGLRWQDAAANAFGTRTGDSFSGSSPVGSFGANAWGLVDVLGNAMEWVEDGYHPNYLGAPATSRPWLPLVGGADAPARVVRGGGFTSSPVHLRLSARDQRAPDDASRATGFRCAADG